jgi:hypothetical protein
MYKNYTYNEYPKILYPGGGKEFVIVSNREEEDALKPKVVLTKNTDYADMPLDEMKIFARGLGLRVGNIGKETLVKKINDFTSGA